jgi:hypothetical protein
MFDFNFQPDSYWDGRGLEQGDPGYQRSQPAVFEGLVGEYLPEKMEGEVEIVFVEKRSTTGDVMSLRAVPEKGEIRYRLVDEYEEVYELPFETSIKPLTFSELTSMLNEIEHYDAKWLERQYRVDIDSGDDLEWISMKSDYYPELADWNEWNFEQVRKELEK